MDVICQISSVIILDLRIHDEPSRVSQNHHSLLLRMPSLPMVHQRLSLNSHGRTQIHPLLVTILVSQDIVESIVPTLLLLVRDGCLQIRTVILLILRFDLKFGHDVTPLSEME